MANYLTIEIWNGCDPAVAKATRQFLNQWPPFSAVSRRYPIVQLIQKTIDPAVFAYFATLPAAYSGFFPGASTQISFSTIIRQVGMEPTNRLQRLMLRQFINTIDTQDERDTQFVATLETLIELIWACASKKAARVPLRDTQGRPRELNSMRRLSFCEFCGAYSELSTFAKQEFSWRGTSENDELRLSSRYCNNHRPKLANGEWNPKYRQAKRSLNRFNLELDRCTRQAARRSKRGAAQSGDAIIDDYFFHFFTQQTLTPADQADLRNLARKMVDRNLTDSKKKILALQLSGLNQSEIARVLTTEEKPLSRQAVSKALASISDELRL
ncbi:LuxR family transcriptional regulator [Herbaspirillum seropedicae]|uniref:LuxR family transcriptional regulator n=1 Tax=Herbaspirillum seropedicae TaxID=964 RepID=UPI001FD1A7AE|nr:LuxR family transcriptional regulator [Herbaspirillum seropedicae]